MSAFSILAYIRFLTKRTKNPQPTRVKKSKRKLFRRSRNDPNASIQQPTTNPSTAKVPKSKSNRSIFSKLSKPSSSTKDKPRPEIRIVGELQHLTPKIISPYTFRAIGCNLQPDSSEECKTRPRQRSSTISTHPPSALRNYKPDNTPKMPKTPINVKLSGFDCSTPLSNKKDSILCDSISFDDNMFFSFSSNDEEKFFEEGKPSGNMYGSAEWTQSSVSITDTNIQIFRPYISDLRLVEEKPEPASKLQPPFIINSNGSSASCPNSPSGGAFEQHQQQKQRPLPQTPQGSVYIESEDEILYNANQQVYRQEMNLLVEKYNSIVSKQQLEIDQLKRLLNDQKQLNSALTTKLSPDSPIPSKHKVRSRFIPIDIVKDNMKEGEEGEEQRVTVQSAAGLMPPFISPSTGVCDGNGADAYKITGIVRRRQSEDSQVSSIMSNSHQVGQKRKTSEVSHASSIAITELLEKY
ncbi:uncharacterized protein J8A68_004533 [[Candida] subhashii]|uniref:Uncharacterized protein n=1 Tax=[Candida] subhashii TaxID=561895 RepID=A0A8J5QSC6_9ASCO|nr:uncharacterized protein J8A68_004533 [[Candida] subhashii]KAG7661930.1 hypothetical protein J8A68_004533 [[Candida] subhashii]